VAFAAVAANETTLEVFTSPGCPACEAARPFLDELRRDYPQLTIREFDLYDRAQLQRLLALARARGKELVAAPSFHLDGHLWLGDSAAARAAIRAELDARFGAPAAPTGAGPPAVTIPGLGSRSPEELSLPLLTVVLGLLDSINPCAFFVLLFILSLLIHARSRRTMLLVGGLFVLCSGVVYFLFMAAWLNLFLLFGQLPLLTVGAGVLALVVAGFNIKDFFWFKRGPTLSLPDDATSRLSRRVRQLLATSRLPTLAAGTVALALVANSYELLCTAGFPMVYTRALTLHQLPAWSHYGYLVLYNLIYVLPLLAIVAAFVFTLGSHKLSEWQGRLLKLFSGCIMLEMGLILLIQPAWLTRGAVALALPVGALAATTVLGWWWRGR